MKIHPIHVHHSSSDRYIEYPGKYLQMGTVVSIYLKTLNQTRVVRAFVRTCPDGEETLTEMRVMRSSTHCTWWSADISIDMPVISYRFMLLFNNGIQWYNGIGVFEGSPTDDADFRLVAGLRPVEWARRSVFYQIFPDRFCDGDPSNNPIHGEAAYRGEIVSVLPWGQESQAHGRGKSFEFYGGDLKGIESRLDYLKDLGVNALYLTPIFPALTNHHYDVIDYFDVDPHLGGKPALISLRDKSSALGMRILLDIVPNHCGIEHPWFKAAQADANSETAEFFTFQNHPDDYACWLGVKSLPKLNYASAKLRGLVYGNPDSIFKTWLREPYQVDGWRIDVANMLGRQGAVQMGEEIGRGIREAVKSVNPEAYLLGENFFDASHQLQGQFLDGNMNYSGFMRPVLSWLMGEKIWNFKNKEWLSSGEPIATSSLVETWLAYLAVIPYDLALQQFNILDSHDTERIQSVMGGNLKLQKLAIALQFCFPGIPCIYYGDEIGIPGQKMDNRQCMPWDPSTWNTGLRGFYQRLINLRKSAPALIHGGFEILAVDENVIAFIRESKDQKIIGVFNRGADLRPYSVRLEQADIPDQRWWIDAFSGQGWQVKDGRIDFEILPTGALILCESR